MRIGFDARAIRYRGIGTYSRNLLLRFAHTDVEFVVFCQDDEKSVIPPVESFTLVSANMDPLSPGGHKAFRTLVEKSGVDLLHVPSPWAPTPVPVPLVATIHDVTPVLYPRSVGLDDAHALQAPTGAHCGGSQPHHHSLEDQLLGAERVRAGEPGQGARYPQRRL